MLKKEMTASIEEPHAIITCGYRTDPGNRRTHYYWGWSVANGTFGKISRIPEWYGCAIETLEAHEVKGSRSNYVKFNSSGEPYPLTITRLDTNRKATFEDYYISSDPLGLTNTPEGTVIPLMFDPPLRGISKKVKQVFTRSRKEGVVNAEQGNATDRERRDRGVVDQLPIRRRGLRVRRKDKRGFKSNRVSTRDYILENTRCKYWGQGIATRRSHDRARRRRRRLGTRCVSACRCFQYGLQHFYDYVFAGKYVCKNFDLNAVNTFNRPSMEALYA